MKKRLIALFMAMTMVFSLAITPAFAALSIDDVVFELKTLKIMEGDDSGDFMLEKPVTRAEFAAIASRMLGMEELAEAYAGQKIYTDVPADHWANGYIAMLSGMNIISGTGGGKFEPDTYLSYENISKILVCSLGYEIWAEDAGGYPGGYTNTATNLGILDGVDISYPFTRQATARAVYNALYVDIMTLQGDDYVISGTTLRDKLSDISDGTVEKREGIVTATVDAYMNNALPDIDTNRIEIDNYLYYTNDETASRYIGQSVVYYVNTEENNRIISIRKSDDNEVITILAEDIKDMSADSISYYTDGNSSKTVKISEANILLKNNRPTPSWTPEEFMNLEQGELTLINNNSDEDNDIDVILYKSYVSVVVEDVNVERNMIYFIDNTMLDGKKYIDVDVERNTNKRIALYKSDGTPATAADVSKDNVISICKSEDGTFIEGVICDAYVEGKISACDKDNVTINGQMYPTETDSVTAEAVFDRDVRAYMNYMGEIVYIKPITTSTNYGYVASLYMDDSATYYGAKMIIPDKLQEKKEEQENEDGGAATVISKIVAQNQELANIEFDAQVNVSRTVNGTATQEKMSGQSAAEYCKGKAIRYTLNSTGRIGNVTVLAAERGGDKKVYNSYERTFAKGNGDNTAKGGFGVDFETRTICVPESETPNSKDYLVPVEMSNGKTYNVVSYEMNEDRHMMDLIVVKAPMKYGTVGELTTSSDVGFVTDVITTIDPETNEETLKITMLAEGTTKEYDITEAYKTYEKYEVPRRGSLVTYLLDNNGKIENLKIVKSYDTMPKFGVDNTVTDYTVFVGYALNADYNYVSNQSNRWVTRMNVGAALDEETSLYYEVFKNNPPPVYLFNSADKSAEFGDIRAIAVGSDVISVFSTNGKVRAIVVIR